ncbi:hypothetical protein RSAG8_01150, partial [Rhizoctonia solani AG-8 WAC10335]
MPKQCDDFCTPGSGLHALWSFISSLAKISSNGKECDRLKLSYPMSKIKEYQEYTQTRHVKRRVLLRGTAELYHSYPVLST